MKKEKERRRTREREKIERHREIKRRRGEVRRGEDRDDEQEFPLKFFLSAAAVGWLLRRCRGVDGRGVGWKKRKRGE